MGKVKLTLSVEEDVVKKARALGLNLSKVCENALQDFIRRLEGPVYRNVNETNPSQVNERNRSGAGGGIRA